MNEFYSITDRIVHQTANSYPFITNAGPELAQFLHNSDAQCSFDSNTNPAALQKIVTNAIERTRKIHVGRNTVASYQMAESLRLAQEAVIAGNAHWESGERIMTASQKEFIVPTSYLVGEQAVEHRTGVPRPFAAAKDIVRSSQNIYDAARKYATNRNYGYGFAILLLTFHGRSPEEIKTCLANKDWLQKNAKTIQGNVFRTSNEAFLPILNELHKLLTYFDTTTEAVGASRNKANYEKAVELLRKNRIDTGENSSIHPLGFLSDTTIEKFMVKFLTVPETILLESKYATDPAVIKYIIETYKGRTTSEIVEATL